MIRLPLIIVGVLCTLSAKAYQPPSCAPPYPPVCYGGDPWIIPKRPVPVAAPDPVRRVQARVTACSPDDPLDVAYYAANGYEGKLSRAVAADPRVFPKGTMLRIPGYFGGEWVPVDSKGGIVIRRSTAKGIVHIDVKYRTLHSARRWGSQNLTIEVKEP